MAEEKVSVKEAPQEVGEPVKVGVSAKVSVTIYTDGAISLNIPDDAPQLNSHDLELIFRNLYERLRDERVAQRALELFKAKL